MEKQNNGVEERQISPPYVAFKTFSNFVDGLRQNGLPNRIDRSVMPNISGGYQKQLLNALEYLGLITEHGRVNPRFEELVAARGELQVSRLGELLRSSYPFLFEDDFLKNATTTQIREKFSQFGLTGDTLSKSVMFFMNAAKQAKIELSPYIKPYKGRVRSAEPRKAGTTTKSSKGSKVYRHEPEQSQDWNQLLLSKFPEFDPGWDATVQAKWFEMFAKLMKTREKGTENEQSNEFDENEES